MTIRLYENNNNPRDIAEIVSVLNDGASSPTLPEPPTPWAATH